MILCLPSQSFIRLRELFFVLPGAFRSEITNIPPMNEGSVIDQRLEKVDHRLALIAEPIRNPSPHRPCLNPG